MNTAYGNTARGASSPNYDSQSIYHRMIVSTTCDCMDMSDTVHHYCGVKIYLQPALHIPEPLSITCEDCEANQTLAGMNDTHEGCNIFVHVELWLSCLSLSAEERCFWLAR